MTDNAAQSGMEELLLKAKGLIEEKRSKEAALFLRSALDIFEKNEKTDATEILAGQCHRLLGDIRLGNFDWMMAEVEYINAVNLGYFEAYGPLGQLFYEGKVTEDMEPDIHTALGFWMEGMAKGVKECGTLYLAHKDEDIPEPEDPVEFTTENGDFYCGDVDEDGLPHGSGTMTYGKGATMQILGRQMPPEEYCGTFEHGKRCGRGVMSFNVSGKGLYSFKYSGQWKDDLPDGKGKAEQYGSTTTETYEGDWKEGKRHGSGIYYEHWDKGTLPTEEYDGEWVEDKREGQGVCSYASPYSHSPKEYYKGGWKGGRRFGHGRWEWPDGSMFEGEWDGDKNGPGTFTTGEGFTFSGVWKNGKVDMLSVKSEEKFLKLTIEASGFDYHHRSVCLLPVKEGSFTFGQCIPLGKGAESESEAVLEITAIDPDGTVHYTVPGTYTQSRNPLPDSIAPRQVKSYEWAKEASAEIYGDTHEYTIKSGITIESAM